MAKQTARRKLTSLLQVTMAARCINSDDDATAIMQLPHIADCQMVNKVEVAAVRGQR